MVLGLSDITIISVYILCILSAVACALYSIKNWNKEEEDETEADV